MAFTPILVDKSIDYVRNRSAYRNSNRESLWGSPVFFTPSNWPANTAGGYGGPRYGEQGGYNYDDSPYRSDVGNCTWWCEGRIYETQGTHHGSMGNGVDWYNNYSGYKSRNANSITAGDVIVFSDGGYGHVMFVEQVDSDGTIHISQSAASSRISAWNGYACRVGTYNKSAIYQGNTIDMYKDISGQSAYNLTVIGVIHTGGGSPGPTPEPEEPAILISPSSYSVTMESEEDYVDFPFNITISGIPDGESASGGNTWSSQLSRVANTGWSYTSYTGSDGETYQQASKSQTLRYERESDGEYSITTHMYFNLTFLNGSINTDTVMQITVKKKKAQGILMLEWDGATVQIL